MKQLELQLQKRLLIVEVPEGTIKTEIRNNRQNTEIILIKFYKDADTYKLFPFEISGKAELICKGDELPEEVAKGFLLGTKDGFYADYSKSHESGYLMRFKSPMQSLISAIEAKGYFWKKNELTDSITAPDIEEWNELQSVTFNPSRTLIFKIS